MEFFFILSPIFYIIMNIFYNTEAKPIPFRFDAITVPLDSLCIYYHKQADDILVTKYSYNGNFKSKCNQIFDFPGIFGCLIKAFSNEKFNLYHYKNAMSSDKSIVCIDNIPIIIKLPKEDILFFITLSFDKYFNFNIHLNRLSTLLQKNHLTIKDDAIIQTKESKKIVFLKTADDLQKSHFVKKLILISKKETDKIKEGLNSIFKEESISYDTNHTYFGFYNQSQKQYESICSNLVKIVNEIEFNMIRRSLDECNRTKMRKNYISNLEQQISNNQSISKYDDIQNHKRQAEMDNDGIVHKKLKLKSNINDLNNTQNEESSIQSNIASLRNDENETIELIFSFILEYNPDYDFQSQEYHEILESFFQDD